MTSSHLLHCPACNGENAPDSRFCRHCGGVLDASVNGAPASIVEPENHAEKPPIAASRESASLDADEMAKGAESGSVSGEIDARRARQLLERAQNLSERGDTTGAILACRQSIALSPTAAAGHAMLGHLLERTGDVTHAATEYEKALQIAPDLAVERDLTKIRTKMGAVSNDAIFHFDDDELFGDTQDNKKSAPLAGATGAAAASIAAASVAAASVAAASVAAASDAEPVAIAEPTDLPPLPNIGAAAPGLPSANAQVLPNIGAAAPGLPSANSLLLAPSDTGLQPERESIKSEIGAASVPVGAVSSAAVGSSGPNSLSKSEIDAFATEIPDQSFTPMPVSPIPNAVSGATSSGATNWGSRLGMPTTIASAVTPILMDDAAKAPGAWSAMRARPSYYGRSLPLVGATIVALGFLSWARNLAMARDVANPPTTVVVQNNGPVDPLVPPTSNEFAPSATNPNSGAGAPPPLSPVGGAAPSTGGFPISNQPLSDQQLSGSQAGAPASPLNAGQVNAGQANARTNAAAGAPARAANVPGGGTRTSSVPRRATPRFPLSIPPAPIPAASSNTRRNNDSGDFILPAPEISAPAPAAPPTSVLPSGQTTPLNPAGASGRGYVRITQGRIGSALPQRPSARASADERAAADATRTGATDRAINNLTSAINSNSGDAGFQLQQRATLFLNRADYSRAAEDFQSAISAYNDQIGRGEQVAAARAGIRASRSGLNVALAGGRN